MTNETPSPPVSDADLVERAVQAACVAADIHLACSYPDCGCRLMPMAVCAVIPLVVEECAKVAEHVQLPPRGDDWVRANETRRAIVSAIRRLKL